MKQLFNRLFTVCSIVLLAASSAMANPQDAPLPCGEAPDRVPFDGVPPYLKGVALSEAQQDRIFAILHAQVPLMRENEKQKRKTFDALAALTQADTLDEKQVQQLAEKLGNLTKEAALNRTLTEYKIFSLLTPEQRGKALEFKHRVPANQDHHRDPVNFKLPGSNLLQRPIAM